jgi:hypothetical protein
MGATCTYLRLVLPSSTLFHMYVVLFYLLHSHTTNEGEVAAFELPHDHLFFKTHTKHSDYYA